MLWNVLLANIGLIQSSGCGFALDVITRTPLDLNLSSPVSSNHSASTASHVFYLEAVAQPLVKAAAAASDPHSELRLITFNWDAVRKYLIITTFLLIAIVIKILHANFRIFHTYLPESCLLICCGIFIGFIKSQLVNDIYLPQFSIEIFFYLLIPPIMLEAAFSLHDKVFFENIGTILSYAVLGTLINVVLISGSLYAVSLTGLYDPDRMSLIEFVVFSIIISAIDPVAVLTIFEEINVNKDIYFLVFGESLLNDAVVITLYNTVVTLKSFANLNGSQVGLALSSFVIVSFGGAFCGLVLGLFSSVAAKYCRRVRVVEPLLMLVLAYFSYVIGELFHLSGIISLICCGLAQAQFARLNISRKSFITVRYITKTLSALADNVIFIFLGMLLVQQNHLFNAGFFGTSFTFAVIHRFVSIYLLSFFSNRLYGRARMIRQNEQFLMAYGGLRGAIAFSLAYSMPNFLVHRQLLTSSVLQLVVASVFLFGCTMKPLVKYLKIRSDSTPELSLLECMNRRMQLYILAGIEHVTGQRSFNALAERYVQINEQKLRPILVNSSAMHNQLAVELRFMLEQLYVKHTNPHTDVPPLPHVPGNAVRILGQSLFQRVRRLSSMRRPSNSSDRSKCNERKRRPTDEVIALQRSQKDEAAVAALCSRTRRSAGETPLFCTPIQMPLPPPTQPICSTQMSSGSGSSSSDRLNQNKEHRVQMTKNEDKNRSRTSMYKSSNQLTVPMLTTPTVSVTDVDDPALMGNWRSIPELRILQIPMMDEPTDVWLIHGNGRSLDHDTFNGIERTASLQTVQTGNMHRKLVRVQVTSLNAEPNHNHNHNHNADSIVNFESCASQRRYTVSNHEHNELIQNKSNKRAKTSQYSVYNTVSDWKSNQANQSASGNNHHQVRSHSAESLNASNV